MSLLFCILESDSLTRPAGEECPSLSTESQCYTMDLTQDVVKALTVHVLVFEAAGC